MFNTLFNSNTLFNAYAEQSKAFLSPVVKFNETLTAHVEKLAKLQIATFNEYADLGLKQFKDAVAVKDLESFQGYATAQFQGIAKLNQKVLDDSKKFVDLGNSLKDELTKLAEENKNVLFAAPTAPQAKAAK
ncbi:MAG: phasin family protein [Gammaproteobacteria bacterium]|nr:phasin family protein [Gammaproteobacteria bacterium]